MSLSNRYRNFSVPDDLSPDAIETSQEELEGAKLDSFEAGYQDGWDDAIKAQGQTDAKLTEDFVQTIQDMSFTYQEAYVKLSEGMRPILISLVTKLLPKIAEQSIGPQINQQLAELMDQEGRNIIEIAVAPEKQALIEKLVSENTSAPFTVTSEQALSSGQIYLRVNDREREINLDAVLEGATSAIEAFFHSDKKEIPNG